MTTTKAVPMTAFQAHSDLAEAHSTICDVTRTPGVTQEGYDVIIRAMAHIRGQMSALSVVLLGCGQ